MCRYHEMPVYYDAYYYELALATEAERPLRGNDEPAETPVKLPRALPLIAMFLAFSVSLGALAQWLQ